MRAVTVWMSMDFSKENRIYKIYWEIVPLNHNRETIKSVGQYKLGVLFQELRVSFLLFNYNFRLKISFQMDKYTPFLEKNKRPRMKKNY